MGSGSALLGQLVRSRLIEARTDRWRSRLAEEHDLSPEELDALAPYIEYVSRYGSRGEFVALVLAFVPFALVLAGILLGVAGGPLGAVLLGRSAGLVLLGGLTAVLPAFLALALLGLVGYVLWRRWRRYRRAATIRGHLTTRPRRLRERDDLLPRGRDEGAAPGAGRAGE